MIKALIFFLLITRTIFSQQFIREIEPFTVTGDSGIYHNAFSGGGNNIEMQFVDIDGDNDFDMFFLDSDGSFGWYENKGSRYNFDFKMRADTIQGLNFFGWFYFFDMDGDGDLDYFTSNSSNHICVRKNAGSAFSPVFITVTDTLLDHNGNIIYSESGSKPVFADVDGDSDYDFISGNSIGTLNFYENIGNSQSLNFKFITSFWQELLIISGSSPDFLHGASSLEFGDTDNDGDLDLLWGDFFSKSIYFIQNNGTSASPLLQLKYSVYPPNQDSIVTSGFNMPRLCDIDGDGDSDLFVSVLYDPTVNQSLMFYKNNGNSATPDFRLYSSDFLKTLDLGVNSYPVFTDIDGDGDRDLIAGYGKGTSGRVTLLRNTGNSYNWQFILDDDVFASVTGDLVLAPAIGDIDGDGDPDLITGNFDGTLSLYLNIGSLANPLFSGSALLRDLNGNLIDVGLYAAPFLMDIDSDGDLDLISGAFNGRLFLFRNLGGPQSHSFQADDPYFQGIDIGDNSAPFLIDINSDNKPELYVGARNGRLFRYDNQGTVSAPHWVLRDTILISTRLGGNIVPVLVDSDGDTDFDLFAGCAKGGLLFFRNNDISTGINTRVTRNEIHPDIYPNPTNGYFKVQGNCGLSFAAGELIIYNLPGEKILEEKLNSDLSGEFTYICSGEGVSSKLNTAGIYLIVVRFPGYHKSAKLAIVK